MTSKFTPGPWFVRATGDDETFDINSRDERGMQWTLATSGEADARLMASAPELLEALKALAEAFESRCGDYENADFNKVYRDAMAAISKAEGA